MGLGSLSLFAFGSVSEPSFCKTPPLAEGFCVICFGVSSCVSLVSDRGTRDTRGTAGFKGEVLSDMWKGSRGGIWGTIS